MEFVPPKKLKKHKIVLTVLSIIYFALFVLTFVAGLGAKCGKKKGPINSRTYPLCFVFLMVQGIVFYAYTWYLKMNDYDIDHSKLDLKA